MTALLDAPCIFCGYNGQRYYSEWTHAKSCPWHSVGGAAERTEQLRMVIQEQAERLEAAGREIAALREHYETSLELESALHAKIEERQAAEIAALRGRIREAYSMLRPLISWQGGEIYKPTIRLPALEEWEATPEVQRALEEER